MVKIPRKKKLVSIKTWTVLIETCEGVTVN